MDPAIWRRLLQRNPDSHKYDYGHVLVVGGAPGMVGAPWLAALAALRAGAGLVTIASSPDVIDKLEKRVTEIMTRRLNNLADDLVSYIKERKVSVLVIGPGMQPAAASEAIAAVKNLSLPLVIDGGGLAALAADPGLLAGLPADTILTPHPGEFSRFFKDQPSDQNQAAIGFAKHHKLNLVLKSHPGLVINPAGEVYENTAGGPGLATAGSGDVLSGVIGALLAQDLPPYQAACAGAYLHGLAGDLAAKAKTEPGMIASDVIEALPEAFKKA